MQVPDSGGEFLLDDARRQRLHDEWNSATDGIVALSADLSVLWANDALGVMLQTDLATWQGRQPIEMVHADDLERVASSFESLAAHAGRRGPNTFRVVGADGTSMLVQVWGDNRLDDPDFGCLALHLETLLG